MWIKNIPWYKTRPILPKYRKVWFPKFDEIFASISVKWSATYWEFHYTSPPCFTYKPSGNLEYISWMNFKSLRLQPQAIKKARRDGMLSKYVT